MFLFLFSFRSLLHWLFNMKSNIKFRFGQGGHDISWVTRLLNVCFFWAFCSHTFLTSRIATVYCGASCFFSMSKHRTSNKMQHLPSPNWSFLGSGPKIVSSGFLHRFGRHYIISEVTNVREQKAWNKQAYDGWLTELMPRPWRLSFSVSSSLSRARSTLYWDKKIFVLINDNCVACVEANMDACLLAGFWRSSRCMDSMSWEVRLPENFRTWR